MAITTLAEAELDMDTMTLIDFLDRHVGDDSGLVVVYVQDDTGRTFERVKLVAETLSDGSIVHNLILSGDA